MTEGDETRSLDLPADVVASVERRLPGTEFDTPEAYVTYILKTVLARTKTESDEDFQAVDEAEVKNKLRSLGYLDE